MSSEIHVFVFHRNYKRLNAYYECGWQDFNKLALDHGSCSLKANLTGLRSPSCKLLHIHLTFVTNQAYQHASPQSPECHWSRAQPLPLSAHQIPGTKQHRHFGEGVSSLSLTPGWIHGVSGCNSSVGDDVSRGDSGGLASSHVAAGQAGLCPHRLYSFSCCQQQCQLETGGPKFCSRPCCLATPNFQ